MILQFEDWNRSGRLADLVRYHIVSCETLMLSDLKSTKLVVSTSGYMLHFSLEQVTCAHISQTDRQVLDSIIQSVDHHLYEPKVSVGFKNRVLLCE